MSDERPNPTDWTVVSNSPFSDQFRPPPGLDKPPTQKQQSPVADKYLVERVDFILNEALAAVNHDEDPTEYILQAIGLVNDLSRS